MSLDYQMLLNSTPTPPLTLLARSALGLESLSFSPQRIQ